MTHGHEDLPASVETVRNNLTKNWPSKEPQFWESKRQITHEEAKEAAGELVDHYFNNSHRVQTSVPANPEQDTDLVLHTYIRQQARKEENAVIKGEEADFIVEAAIWHGFDPLDEDYKTLKASEEAIVKLVTAARRQGREDMLTLVEPFDKWAGVTFSDDTLCTIRVYAKELRALHNALRNADNLSTIPMKSEELAEEMPLTRTELAEALDSFWNASISRAHGESTYAFGIVSAMAEGFAAIASSLRGPQVAAQSKAEQALQSIKSQYIEQPGDMTDAEVLKAVTTLVERALKP